MKFLTLMLLIGCSTVKLYKPKFEPGDCIRSYDSYNHIITQMAPEAHDGGGYIYTVGFCRTSDYRCSTGYGTYENIDRNSVQISCPKGYGL